MCTANAPFSSASVFVKIRPGDFFLLLEGLQVSFNISTEYKSCMEGNNRKIHKNYYARAYQAVMLQNKKYSVAPCKLSESSRSLARERATQLQ